MYTLITLHFQNWFINSCQWVHLGKLWNDFEKLEKYMCMCNIHMCVFMCAHIYACMYTHTHNLSLVTCSGMCQVVEELTFFWILSQPIEKHWISPHLHEFSFVFIVKMLWFYSHRSCIFLVMPILMYFIILFLHCEWILFPYLLSVIFLDYRKNTNVCIFCLFNS